ncbi:TPA: hypothetical protein ACGO7B_002109 [Streptococcus suis]|uniref:hypothetical protein n=3 Tax=Streptococcus suis TaxID=1307 RepID=UPI000420D68E|nr:hypothetical protein [Streptococcus suis]CYU68516.1 Uncharacterised protein [Streptococcus suis]HEL1600565.1 hypothetical protein [Streptococcus suis]HEL9646606.1 hypothetical protein [Streptococcus suis]HEM2799830.1 hypothetical protein [Streptococcus suis]HEM3208868.1 hypothetical protein [Streptococcus suis 22083]
MTWNKDYFSKIEFIIHIGNTAFGYFKCNLMMSELSYQECGNTGTIIFEHSQKLSEKELSNLLPYVLLSNFESYRQERIFLKDSKIVGFRDVFSITFKGYSQDGQALLTYEMAYVYKDWYNRPIDKLYSYISDTYFSDNKKERCFIAHGLMASVHPV